jgi:general stress protein 26
MQSIKSLVKAYAKEIFALANKLSKSKNLWRRRLSLVLVESYTKHKEYHPQINRLIELQDNKYVCLNYSHPSKNDYMCITGNAETIHDTAKAKEMWSPLLKAWFQGGPDDTELRLIKVVPNEAAYWDSNSNRMITFFAMIKSAITGKYNEGEHGKLNL